MMVRRLSSCLAERAEKAAKGQAKSKGKGCMPSIVLIMGGTNDLRAYPAPSPGVLLNYMLICLFVSYACVHVYLLLLLLYLALCLITSCFLQKNWLGCSFNWLV